MWTQRGECGVPRSQATGSPVGEPQSLVSVGQNSPRPRVPVPSYHLSATPTVAANMWGLVAERLLDLSASFSSVLTRVQVFVRRLLELHVFKLVALYTVWVALKEVSVGHTPSSSAVGLLKAPHWPLWILGAHRGGNCPTFLAQPHLFHLPPGVSNEPLAGGALGLRPALPPLQAHGLLPVHGMDLHHHRVQDALPAQSRQPS